MKFAKSIHYVSSVTAALDFYRTAFGFEIRYLHESKEYGELNTGETTLAFATNRDNRGNCAEHPEKDYAKTELQFITDDVAAIFEKAVNAGAIPLKEPVQKPTGQTVALIKAIDGNFVEIITP